MVIFNNIAYIYMAILLNNDGEDFHVNTMINRS